MNAKSLKVPVNLFLIWRISRTGTNDSNIYKSVLSSTSVTTGPLIIRLQFCADSSRKGLEAGWVLQLRRLVADFSVSHRQHLFRLAKFLQSHLSQYQSQATLRSTFRIGKYCILKRLLPMLASPFRCSITEMAASMLGYFKKSLSPCVQTQSGRLVPMLMLRSVNMLSASLENYATPSSRRVRVSSSLKRGWYFSVCGSYFSLGLRDRERYLSLL